MNNGKTVSENNSKFSILGKVSNYNVFYHEMLLK